MGNLGRVIRTVIHLKPVQVLNRLWRKRPIARVSDRPLPRRPLVPGFQFPKVATVWDGEATFTFLNTTHRLVDARDWNNPEWEKLWLYNLHYFDCLRQRNSPADSAAAMRLIERWIRENPIGRGNGWEPYPISLRVVNWVKFLLTAGAEASPEVLASLAAQVRHLEKRLEYHLLANHLLANAKALVFAGMFFSGDEAERWLKKGLAIYLRELPRQTCRDGVNFERSPMYHCIILEDLLDCLQVSSNHTFAGYAKLMLGGLETLTGPDGKIAKFNDSAEGISLTVADLVSYAAALRVDEIVGDVRTLAESSGYIRKSAGDYTLIAKCGEIGPGYQPGHAHADTFSFELWKGTQKLIGDTGCSTYVPGALRSYERSTLAHNAVVVGGQDSSEVWASHRVGRRAHVVSLECGESAAEIVGVYRDQFGNEIRRKLSLNENGLSGEDEIKVACLHGDVANRDSDKVEVRFHLPPDATCDLGRARAPRGPQSCTVNCNGERREEPCEFSAGWNRRVCGTRVIYSLPPSPTVVFRWSICDKTSNSSSNP